MCHKLFQIHACGHTKEVCTTPCPHALATAYYASTTPADPFSDAASSPTTPRYPSAPSSASPTAGEFGPLPQLVAKARSAVNSLPSQCDRDQPPTADPTSPHSVISNHPSPLRSNPTTSLVLPNSAGGEPELTANFCPYYFSRYLTPSKTPCLKCYMRPDWTNTRQRWMTWYRIEHPGTKPEDLASLAGVEGIPGRVGLVNVFAEMQRLGSVKAAQNASQR
ncbi:hypothetical protein BU26DRAFT_302584 [Trematosphaeria pertusa]|uniref:Uncharacterized protein n=1 Tax=Trematosphaeria pertusa TaxID=390896 RepID=A0A6A6IEL0_9PLEO|nr:uncharacterized protein BU26DRAFT_302584 [Trematosphaeria pertusa]KAF2248629.1 hypothetical protein BU26DRAFT_302584 [Trematosphaeria pertusa]